LEDIDMKLGEVTVLGKGRRIRRVSMGVKTTRAVDRYLRVRRTHEWASTTECAWLGLKGVLTENGIRQMLERRANQAGLGHLNLHRLRHTWAHHMKLSGMPDSDLQNQGGWSSPAMLARYGASATGERARKAHRRYSLGDKV
jgi:site-specific recombinase XerC